MNIRQITLLRNKKKALVCLILQSLLLCIIGLARRHQVLVLVARSGARFPAFLVRGELTRLSLTRVTPRVHPHSLSREARRTRFTLAEAVIEPPPCATMHPIDTDSAR